MPASRAQGVPRQFDVDAADSNLAIDLCDMHFSWPGPARFYLHVEDLTVERGQKIFLHGPSGSGKSTLLNVICGIARPQQGQVLVDRTDMMALSGAQRDQFRADRIGIIFQMFNLLPFASGLQNILLPLEFSGERRRRVTDGKAEALRLTSELGLDPKLVTKGRAGDLSIGQQQRIAAARALIGSPHLIIADEPTSALDADAQAAFVDLLMTQAGAMDATLLMVSHDIRLADRFDRMIALSDIATNRKAVP